MQHHVGNLALTYSGQVAENVYKCGFSRLDNKWAIQRAPSRHILETVPFSRSHMDHEDCLYFSARRWRCGDASEAVGSRGCAMPKSANLRARRITDVARFGISNNVYVFL
ncbi:hypothetical protein Y032_0502g2615 [Ancylostoma ceylanicum]|uniref:Uncharacterized protein n=1 Tax=Ancylostoma ceylanicum TaxID=53326 RepID=A0A016WTJ0_9BILA|nr:hypothetical protein Y032_0502g2615 [Ancylostoma ceylanicum]